MAFRHIFFVKTINSKTECHFLYWKTEMPSFLEETSSRNIMILWHTVFMFCNISLPMISSNIFPFSITETNVIAGCHVNDLRCGTKVYMLSWIVDVFCEQGKCLNIYFFTIIFRSKRLWKYFKCRYLCGHIFFYCKCAFSKCFLLLLTMSDFKAPMLLFTWLNMNNGIFGSGICFE